uniref:Uncharacterized protein n=1 Tax=Candidatus Nitrotoga fabula TaxID=2182327 RepID=A0A2X0QUR0_9PROT|nr:protein of unknown function [Candidatus Nitrotoga fabula]
MVNDTKPKPYYELASIKTLVNLDQFFVVNRRANNNLQDLDWDLHKLKCFILALKEEHFVNTYPECEINNGHAIINCDGYKMQFDDANLKEDKREGLEFFIKLAISNYSKALIVSFHLS